MEMLVEMYGLLRTGLPRPRSAEEFLDRRQEVRNQFSRNDAE
jgi:hypothetical protein